MTQVIIKDAQGEVLKELEANPAKPLLSQLEWAWVEIPNACKIWMCGACICIWENDDENLVKNLRGEPAFPLWEGEIMTCIWWVTDTQETVVLKTMS